MKLKLWILFCIVALIFSVVMATITLVTKPNQALFLTMMQGGNVYMWFFILLDAIKKLEGNY